MNNETILVANLKCAGCAHTITQKLSSLKGMTAVKVDSENDSVTVAYEDNLLRETIISTLLSLGYPEATEANGLLTQLKSYASCMIGKIHI
jgi:copper chaperone